MNAKYRRLFITIIIVLTLGLATKLILIALEDNIVYFYTPNDLIEKFGDTQNIQNKIRIGGLVLEKSIKKEGEKTIFIISDKKKEAALPRIYPIFFHFCDLGKLQTIVIISSSCALPTKNLSVDLHQNIELLKKDK